MKVSNLALLNMQSMGILKNNNESFIFESLNRDFKIIMERKDCSLWRTDTSSKYICKLSFMNNFGIIVYQIICNEIDIMRMVDSFYGYMAENLLDSYYTFNQNNVNACCSILGFRKETGIGNNEIERFVYKDIMMIQDYNIQANIIIPRFSIEFDENKFNEFLDMLYYVFLADIGSITDGNETYFL